MEEHPELEQENLEPEENIEPDTVEENIEPDTVENIEPDAVEENSTYMDENSTPESAVFSTPMGRMDARLIDIPSQELARSPVQIFVIPSYLKERNPDAYQPKMVSIGPYHYGKPELKPMESHKSRAVDQFLNRSRTNAHATEKRYIRELTRVHNQLWNSYESSDQLGGWTKVGFINLMMVDGIFLLEFLNVMHGNRDGNDYADTDPIFGRRGQILNYSYVMEDLLLLENQVPYLVLSKLVSVSEGLNPEETKNYLARLMLAPAEIRGHHLLDMYIKGTLWGRERQEPVMGEGEKVSADELIKTYGMTFKPVAAYKDMKFNRRAKTLELPTIIIDKGTIRRFCNMKTYQVLVGDTASNELISYIHILNFFILSAVDVNTLRSQGIIISSLDSDEAVITIMKELTRETMADNIDDKSAGIITQVTKFYDHKSFLYFCFGWITARWRLVLAVAGTTLYILHFIDAIYSIRYNRKNL